MEYTNQYGLPSFNQWMTSYITANNIDETSLSEEEMQMLVLGQTRDFLMSNEELWFEVDLETACSLALTDDKEYVVFAMDVRKTVASNEELETFPSFFVVHVVVLPMAWEVLEMTFVEEDGTLGFACFGEKWIPATKLDSDSELDVEKRFTVLHVHPAVVEAVTRWREDVAADVES